jgi:hypothetical protein
VTTIELEIVPATADHLRALIESDQVFRTRHGLTVVEGYCEFPEALPRSLDAITEGGTEPQWFSHLFVVPAAGALVGLGGFKGRPRTASSRSATASRPPTGARAWPPRPVAR